MKNKGIFVLDKKEGETPLEALIKLRAKKKIDLGIKMTYAGRLDPMAKGLLLVLAGDEVRNKDKYLSLDKDYEFEILFGFKTDTYDILGKLNEAKHSECRKSDLEIKIKENLQQFTGRFLQQYPLYSGKTVKGKKLFEYAREGKNITAPGREVKIKSLKFLKLREIGARNLLRNVERRIKKVKGDFRQEEISRIWRKRLTKNQNTFYVASFKTTCSSGTYVRGIADSLGEKLGIPALAFSINRTRIGKWSKAE